MNNGGNMSMIRNDIERQAEQIISAHDSVALEAFWSDNSYFDTVNEIIYLPRFRKDDIQNSAGHPAKFDLAHEYAHYLQAISTAFGFGCFRAGTARLIDFLNALTANSGLSIPMARWNPEELSESAKEFITSTVEFGKFFGRLLGGWTIPITSAASFEEYRLGAVDIKLSIGGLPSSIIHVERTHAGARYLIPILGKSLCESHAESFAQVAFSFPSAIFSRCGSEKEKEELFYTSLYGFVRDRLPDIDAAEVLLALSDHALMWWRSDAAFWSALSWLLENPAQMRNSSAEIRRELYRVSGEEKAIDGVLRDLAVLKSHFEQADNVVTQMLRGRLMRCEAALQLRKTNPSYFVRDAEEKTSQYLERLCASFGVARIQLSDGFVMLGRVSPDDLEHQNHRASVSHLLKIVTGAVDEQDPQCPKFKICELEKDEYTCKTAPWLRGPLGSDFCEFGVVGHLLGWFSNLSSAE